MSKDPLLMSFYESMNRQKCVPVAQPFTPNLPNFGKTIQVDTRADICALFSDYLSSVPLSQRLFILVRFSMPSPTKEFPGEIQLTFAIQIIMK